jgi:putative two-component system response regulator
MPECTDRFDAPILIVDDQPANVRLLEHTLRRGGYLRVSSTIDPCSVSALQRSNRYALVILDHQMPVMNGIEVLQELRALETQNRPITLMMSADPSQMLPSLEAGATSFLSKPFVLADVLLQVNGLLAAVAPESETVALPTAVAPLPLHTDPPLRLPGPGAV